MKDKLVRQALDYIKDHLELRPYKISDRANENRQVVAFVDKFHQLLDISDTGDGDCVKTRQYQLMRRSFALVKS